MYIKKYIIIKKASSMGYINKKKKKKASKTVRIEETKNTISF